MRKQICLLFWLFAIAFSNIIKADSTSVYTAASVRFFYANGLLDDSTRFFALDTQLLNFQRFNLSLQNGISTSTLGGLGLASKSLLIKSDSTIGFDYGFHVLDHNLYHTQETRFYDTRSPYTSLTFINGRLKQQSFEATFSENVTPRFNIGFDFRRNGSINYYQRQKVNHTNFRFFGSFLSKNNRYRNFTTFIINKMDAEENGGISNISILENGSLVNPEFEKVKLISADILYRNTVFSFKHRYKLDNKPDSDSISNKKSFKVFQYLTYSENKIEYTDTESPEIRYQDVFLNSSATNDKNFYSMLDHEVGVQFVGFSISGFQQGVFVKQNTQTTNFINTGLRGQINFPVSRFLKVKADAFQIYTGYNSADYSLRGGVELTKNNGDLEAEFGFLSSSKSPAFIYNQFNANTSRWNNDFENVTTQSFFGIFSFKGLLDKIELNVSSIGNVLYFDGVDSVVAPEQFSRSIEVVGITLKKAIRFSKFVIQNQINYQKITNLSILRSPELSGIHSFYFTNKVFNKVLEFNVGFDVSYFTAYQPYSYHAPISQFIASKVDNIESYAQLDLFLVAKLKRAKFMLKFDHFNQGWIKPGYSTTTGYPMPPRTLVIGINWRFFD